MKIDQFVCQQFQFHRLAKMIDRNIRSEMQFIELVSNYKFTLFCLYYIVVHQR